MPRDILFVCFANKERSVTAEYIAKKLFGGEDFYIHSAGVQAEEGDAAGASAKKFLSSVGIDCADHRAALVTGELLEKADIVVCMERQQKRSLQERLLFMGKDPLKVNLLGELAGEPKNKAELEDVGSQELLARVAACVVKAKDKLMTS